VAFVAIRSQLSRSTVPMINAHRASSRVSKFISLDRLLPDTAPRDVLGLCLTHRARKRLELGPIHHIGAGDVVRAHWLEHDPFTDSLDVSHTLTCDEGLKVTSVCTYDRIRSVKYSRFHEVLPFSHFSSEKSSRTPARLGSSSRCSLLLLFFPRACNLRTHSCQILVSVGSGV